MLAIWVKIRFGFIPVTKLAYTFRSARFFSLIFFYIFPDKYADEEKQ